ncbi:MAG TPA: DUF4139 domain-containing protein [Lacunisphaera sp.]|jgi:hypothetical protein|nr:DUF4139 domain-containing protein [Lacunisphaera sp.]
MKIPRFLFPAAALAGIAATAAANQPALTIYNQNFALVREHVPLDLKAGVTPVSFSGVTMHLEPDSVVLRDPSGKVALRVLEQSYRADTISAGLLLSLYEGKELDFLVRDQNAKEYIVKGKVIRSGYTPNTGAMNRYGQQFMMQQQAMGSYGGMGQPIIEVDGKLRFSLPGEPQFPALTDDAILKPALNWQLAADKPAKLDAELSYITGGMSWEASYNLIAPEKGDTLDLVGWVTIDNQSGKQFDQAAVKLMAGDVSKLAPDGDDVIRLQTFAAKAMRDAAAPAVTEKAFDEFHLYSLARPVTLHNRETKQVEFIRATGVKAKTIYVYNGAAIGQQYRGWNTEMIRNNRDYGTQSNPKVWVYREFKNREENGLGQPLPKGRTRFYRRDDADGRLEFTGENTLDHTPKDETVKIYTGDAFDVVGARKRTDYVLNARQDQMEEEFEIKVRNHKDAPVEVRVAERLYRWVNWTIVAKSHDFEKTDAQNIEFPVTVPADGEVTLTYRVRYDWK